MLHRTRVVAMSLAGVSLLTACTSGGAPASAPAPPTAPGPDSRNGPIPAFSRPTDITNAYLPLARGGRWIYEGTKDGKPYLIEVATTADRRTIDWGASRTETVVVRHRGWVEGVLTEQAMDYYAQGDDGGVWYFGEDVDNYADGKLVDHDGSWLAGRDGALPALLMPAAPKLGQVFFSEDIARQKIVERDEVVSLTQRATTPDGAVDNGLLLGATQADGTKEEKIFVPEVGEVLARSAEGEVRLTQRLPDKAESATSAQFSDPANVDNPNFGVTGIDYRLYLGVEDGEPLRVEVAPTGRTKSIGWAGGRTDTTESQFTATSERDLLEIAVDWFAQDDARNVWYFGEDVFNYADGRVADTDGTWIAGRDVPPGLIMPGTPTLGQRFNPENIPSQGIFETVDVQGIGETYTNPAGETIGGAVKLHETLADGVEETKLYAPGYGNVSVAIPGVERLDLVYALPTDAIGAPVPPALTSALDDLEALSVEGTTAAALRGTLEGYVTTREPVPPVLRKLAADQLDALDEAVSAGDTDETRAAAMDLELTVLDLMRLYATNRPVDFDLLDLQARRMLAAVDAADPAAAGVAAAMANGIAQRNTNLLPPVARAAAGSDAAGAKGDLEGVAAAAATLRTALA